MEKQFQEIVSHYSNVEIEILGVRPGNGLLNKKRNLKNLQIII